MPTYEYRNEGTGEVLEVQQRISEPAFTHRTEGFEHAGKAIAGRWLTLPEHKGIRVSIPDDDGSGHSGGRESAYPVKRLISAESGGFQLKSGPSGGWSSSGYSPTPAQRKAEHKLGRKLRPLAK